jgi:hypothetical protein
MLHLRRSRVLVRALLLAAAVFLLVPSAAQAQHWLPGLFPNRVYAETPPGFYAMFWVYNYNAGSLRDSNGDKIFERPDGSSVVSGDFDLFAAIPVLSYTAKPKVLGATYSIRWGQPFTDITLAIQDREGGTGFGVFDPLFLPLTLTWGLGQLDMTVAWGVWLPLGRDDGGTEGSFGSNTQVAGILYFDK